jgi:quercetin dioxygenase-like cupin family protein
MTDADSAVVSLDDLPWTRHGEDTSWAALTEPIGATETEVDALRLAADGSVTLASADEQLLIRLAGRVAVEGRDATLARVPAGVGATVRAEEAATVLLVSAPAGAEPDDAPTVLDLEGVEYTVPSTSDIATAFLTAPLGLRAMKANARRLEPGQAVPAHTEGTQEELFVPLGGPAELRIEGEVHGMTVGHVGRVAPPVPRSAHNPGDEPALWVMVGAPPTGEVDWWDPGAEILE